MKILIEIDEEEYKTLSSLSDREKVNDLMGYEKIIANGTPLNGTNGDVLKAVFPNVIIVKDTEYDCLSISNDFWNADYKGVE